MAEWQNYQSLKPHPRSQRLLRACRAATTRQIASVNMQCKQRCAQVENMPVSSDNQVKMSPFLPLRTRGGLEQSVLAPLTHRGPHSYSGLYNWPKKD